MLTFNPNLDKLRQKTDINIDIDLIMILYYDKLENVDLKPKF